MDNKKYTPINRERGPGYMTIAPPYDQETAIARFEDRYGFPPEEVKPYKGYLMLGPVPEGGE